MHVCSEQAAPTFGHNEMKMALLEWAEQHSIWAIPNKPLFRNGIIVEICTLVRVEKLERNPDLLWLSLKPGGIITHKATTAGIGAQSGLLSQIGLNSRSAFFQKNFSATIVGWQWPPRSMAVNPTYPKHCEVAIFKKICFHLSGILHRFGQELFDKKKINQVLPCKYHLFSIIPLF